MVVFVPVDLRAGKYNLSLGIVGFIILWVQNFKNLIFFSYFNLQLP